MAENKLSWKFPQNKLVWLRLELLFLAILTIIVFIFSYYDFDQSWYFGLLFAVIFLAVYFGISALIQRIRLIQNVYTITPNQIEIHQQHRFGSKKHKIPFKELKHHKLDKTFLGGYLVTHKGKRHSLFFNTRKEVERFESFVKKHLKK